MVFFKWFLNKNCPSPKIPTMFDRMFVTTGQSSGHEKSQPYDGLPSNYSDSAHTVATPQQQYYLDTTHQSGITFRSVTK